MAASALQLDCDLLDSLCIADSGMRECLSFTGQLSHILLADAAAVYTFHDALSSLAAKSDLHKAKRIVFFVSWLSFECKNAMRAIVAECNACEDVSVYSAVSLLEDDPLLHGLDCSCQHLSYPGRAFELQDVEFLLFPSTTTSLLAAPLGSRRDEMVQLIAAQLAGAALVNASLDFASLTFFSELCVSRDWKPQFRVVNEFCEAVVRAARSRIERHVSLASSANEDRHCFVMVIDRLADVRSALQPAECVLQKAIDEIGERANDIQANVDHILMWAKGTETMQALPSGLDALLERKIEDAARETAEMHSENSFPIKSIRVAAEALLDVGACSTPLPSPQVPANRL
jgi:hypothetical protein